MVRAFTQEQAQQLIDRGFAATGRNLYLAHNIGVGGASALLRAEHEGRTGEDAAAILNRVNPTLVPNNAAYNGDGKTVAQALAAVNAAYLRRGPTAQQATEARIRQQDAETRSLAASTAERKKAVAAEDLYNEAKQKGTELSRVYSSGEQVLSADASKLTGEVKAQVEEFQRLAAARARAAAAQRGASAGLRLDLTEGYGALGRTPGEQADYQMAKRVGAPGSQEFQQAYDSLTQLRSVAEAKLTGSSFVEDLVSDLRNGKSFGDALTGSLSNLLSKLGDKAIDKLFNSLFSMADPKGGDIFSGIGKLFGFASGGYTGNGGTGAVAGVVHGREYVFDAASTARIGVGTLEAIRRGVRGYQGGGYVAPAMPAIAMARPAGIGGGAGPINIGGDTINLTGAPGYTPEQFAALLNQRDARLARNINSIVATGRLRFRQP
ncbi:hypothetical protein [Methylobacterium nodulans]|uniref:hypothetical protein n=1 Tax=Methylobacterium nodulans TaxID=114616 RepID=UPI0002FC627F|nr:hypothetical protein [Methylobacterium nodulans]